MRSPRMFETLQKQLKEESKESLASSRVPARIEKEAHGRGEQEKFSKQRRVRHAVKESLVCSSIHDLELKEHLQGYLSHQHADC